MVPRSAPVPPQSVLIVGCGELGASTALSLIKGAYKDHASLITILDRAAEPPAIDAASSDLNKIVRQDYSDPIYAELALEAIRRWRTAEWSSNFYESGVMVGASKAHSQATYVANSLTLNLTPEMSTPGKAAYPLETQDDVRKALKVPSSVAIAEFKGDVLYLNEAGGWANARAAVTDTVQRLRDAGVRFEQGEAAQLIIRRINGNSDVKGVRTRTGAYFADFVISCIGSWTPVLVPELAAECLPTGQVVAMIQLTDEEYEKYKNIPVTLFLDTGFYSFPPNHEKIIKFAIHGKGWTSPSGKLPSLPRTILSTGYENQHIPAVSVAGLKAGFARVYPELAAKKWVDTRLCWYGDRPSGDWLLDYHPEYPSFFIAAGDSGHAFKFMPVIGDLVVTALGGKLSEIQKKMWSFKHGIPGRIDGSRAEATTRLLDSSVMAKL